MNLLFDLIAWMSENEWEEVNKSDIRNFMNIVKDREIKRLTTEICIYKDLLYKMDFADYVNNNKEILKNFFDKDMHEFLDGNRTIPEKTTEVTTFLENLIKDKIKE